MNRLPYSIEYARTNIDIMAQMLHFARDGITKMGLMRKSYLPYVRLNYYVQMLTKHKLLEYLAETGKYRTTDRGSRFLRLYREMNECLTRS